LEEEDRTEGFGLSSWCVREPGLLSAEDIERIKSNVLGSR
jgi:hypothetical protein